MTGRRVLITNDQLSTRFGAETATRDLAFGLAVVVERYNTMVSGTQVQLSQQLDYFRPRVM